MSPIQQGIQSGHAIAELGMKCYREQGLLRTGTNWTKYQSWATKWKTVICLNAGNFKDLCEIIQLFGNSDLPFASFNESYASLGGIPTSIAAIIPKPIFDIANDLRYKVVIPNSAESYNTYQRYYDIITLLSETKMAK